MKRHLLFLMGLGAAMKVAAGIAPPYGWTSEPMTLDIESGVRQTIGVESLAYDAAWVVEATNGMTFKVSVNGAEEAQVGAYGVLDWQGKRPGNYTVTAQAYQGGALVGETLAATFAVAGHDLVNAEVTVDAANMIYDGAAKCPAVVVRLSDKTLTEGVDYDLSYENNVAAGVGKVVITGMGKYVDEIERPFTIRPACCCPLDVQSGSRQAPYVDLFGGGNYETAGNATGANGYKLYGGDVRSPPRPPHPEEPATPKGSGLSAVARKSEGGRVRNLAYLASIENDQSSERAGYVRCATWYSRGVSSIRCLFKALGRASARTSM